MRNSVALAYATRRVRVVDAGARKTKKANGLWAKAQAKLRKERDKDARKRNKG